MTTSLDYIGVVVGTTEGITSTFQGTSGSGGTVNTIGTISGINGALTAPLTVTPAGAMILGPDGVMIGIVKVTVEINDTNSFAPGDVLTVLGAGAGAIAGMALVAGGALPFGAISLLLTTALGIAGSLLNLSGYRVPVFQAESELLSTWELEGLPMLDEINTLYNLARIPESPYVDPLVLDLDGDGIETVGIRPGAAVLFDHDGDGIKTGSGWVKADDGILVLDLDGNGQIETGRELFGDRTLVQGAGQRSANGLAALAQYDTNADARIDSADAIYGQLQVWQDLNQDGISQSGELHTLNQLGIASLQVSGTASNTPLIDASTGMASGNTLHSSAGFTRVDGSTGVSGCAARRRGGSRTKTGVSPRGLSIVCYQTRNKQKNEKAGVAVFKTIIGCTSIYKESKCQ